jgi:hypothetical protein
LLCFDGQKCSSSWQGRLCETHSRLVSNWQRIPSQEPCSRGTNAVYRRPNAAGTWCFLLSLVD